MIRGCTCHLKRWVEQVLQSHVEKFHLRVREANYSLGNLYLTDKSRSQLHTHHTGKLVEQHMQTDENEFYQIEQHLPRDKDEVQERAKEKNNSIEPQS